jgi:hypothetical protein
MRGDERFQDGMFSYVTLEQRVAKDHPLRAIRRITDVVLRSLSQEFDSLYSASGRPSMAPEYVLRTLVRGIVGLYLNPPERALVLCVDEKSQIQALDRTALSMNSGSRDSWKVSERCGARAKARQMR